MPETEYKRLSCVDCGISIWKGSTRCKPCAHPPVVERACAGCGSMFKPKKTGNKGLYCSRECAYAHWHQWKSPVHGRSGWRKYPDAPGPHCKVFFKICAVCGKPFTTGWDKKLTCSDCVTNTIQRKQVSIHVQHAARRSARTNLPLCTVLKSAGQDAITLIGRAMLALHMNPLIRFVYLIVMVGAARYAVSQHPRQGVEQGTAMRLS